MPQIILNLTDEAATNYAAYKGYSPTIPQNQLDGTITQVQNPQAVTDFITDDILDSITSDLVNQRTANAIAAVQSQPAPVVTMDQQESQDGSVTN